MIFGGACAGKVSLSLSSSNFISGSGTGIARQAQLASIRGWHVYVDHLHGSKFLQYAAWGETRSARLELLTQRDV